MGLFGTLNVAKARASIIGCVVVIVNWIEWLDNQTWTEGWCTENWIGSISHLGPGSLCYTLETVVTALW